MAIQRWTFVSYISFELEFKLVSTIAGFVWFVQRFVALALCRSSTSLPCSWLFCWSFNLWPNGVWVGWLDGLSSGKDRSRFVLRPVPDLGGLRLPFMGVLWGGRSDGDKLRKYLPVGKGILLFWLPPFLAMAICNWNFECQIMTVKHFFKYLQLIKYWNVFTNCCKQNRL